MTQAQIQNLIDQITTGTDYTADEMRPLLTQLLSAAYGPMYIAAVAPSATTDEASGYRPGSVGYDTQTQRYYICQSALAGNAVWILIPVDSKFEPVAYTANSQDYLLQTNTTIVKVTSSTFDSCLLRLPANPFNGKTVVVYFSFPQTQFTFADSVGTIVNGGNVLTIPAGQQFTFTYSGTAWEIVGINNTTAGTLSGVDIEENGTNIVSDTTFINFTGAVNVTPSTTGVEVEVLTNAGIDVQDDSSTVKSSAQFINFTGSNIAATANGLGADIAVNPTITIRKENAVISTTCNEIRFKGSIFTTVSGATAVAVISDGPKSWTGTANAIPGANDDSTAGYSLSSVGRNTGNLLRTYICRDNTTGAAIWDQVTLDYKTELVAMTNNGSYSLAPNTANAILSSSVNIVNYTLVVPLYQYEGKTITVYATTTLGSINAFTLSVTGGTSVIINLGPGVTYASLKFVCINPTTQDWRLIGKSIS